MATKREFIKENSKLIPDFDGDINDLQKFIDALSLVSEDVGAHEGTAVKLIKTKLSGIARILIRESGDTIEKIVDRLKSNIKGETSDIVVGKIKNLKQGHKSATVYMDELKKLPNSLRTAYVSEGLDFYMADKFCKKAFVDAVKINATDKEIIFIIKAGCFNSVDEVIHKFIISSNEHGSKKILTVRKESQEVQKKPCRFLEYIRRKNEKFAHEDQK